MTVDVKMTAIADALRLKKNGTTDELSLDDMANSVLDLGYTNIPTYHYEEAGRLIQNVRAWKASHTNSLVFGAISDIHVFANDATRASNTEKSIRHASFALETVSNMAGCDFIVNLGDNCWENGIDTDNAIEGSEYVHDAIQSAFGRMTSYRLVGNHDRSGTTQKAYDLIGKYNYFDAWGTTQIRGFGYKDWTAKKVRVICLNTTDYLNITGGCALSYDQKDFLLRALDLSSKSDASEWQILLLSHIPLDYDGGDYNYTADLNTILSAYVNGTTATISVNSSHAVNEIPSNYATYSNGSLVYNYYGKNVAKIIANIHGHVHNNCNGKINGVDIVRISTPNTCFYEAYQTKYGYGVSAEEYAKLTKTAGTARDTAATFYCIDLDKQVIDTFSYGAGGSDLSISYKGGASFSITYKLTNMKSSTTTNTAVEGSSFTTTLTTTQSDATINSVVVTMGGVDITASTYSNGVVTITNVTGDIVITAVAAVPAFEYIVPDLDCATRMDWYVTGSTFTLGSANGYLALGVSTANSYGFADRESGTLYLMPIPASANNVFIETTDTSFVDANIYIVSDSGGTLTSVYNSGWFAKNIDGGWTAEFNRSLGNWIAINLSYSHDGSIKTPWGYDAKSKVTVTFTNGVSDDSGGSDEPSIDYTNLFSTSDANYSVGRLNSSGAVNTSYANGFVSGYISATKGDVIRAKSANTAFLNTYGVIAFYNSSKTYISQIYINDSAGRITMSSDNKEFCCDTSTLAASFDSTAFVRIMGYGSPDGFIITKNEEIN